MQRGSKVIDLIPIVSPTSASMLELVDPEKKFQLIIFRLLSHHHTAGTFYGFARQIKIVIIICNNISFDHKTRDFLFKFCHHHNRVTINKKSLQLRYCFCGYKTRRADGLLAVVEQKPYHISPVATVHHEKVSRAPPKTAQTACNKSNPECITTQNISEKIHSFSIGQPVCYDLHNTQEKT